jgi:osmotically inducible lipoprotein OsmB
MRKLSISLLLIALTSVTTGCASWDAMSSRQKSTVGGAAIGGVVGAAVSGGSVLSTVGGAAIGGVIGNQAGRH